MYDAAVVLYGRADRNKLERERKKEREEDWCDVISYSASPLYERYNLYRLTAFDTESAVRPSRLSHGKDAHSRSPTVRIGTVYELFLNVRTYFNVRYFTVRQLCCTKYLYEITETRSIGTVHTSTKARRTSVAIRIRIQIRDPDRHQNLTITGPLPTFPENFMQTRSEVFAQSC